MAVWMIFKNASCETLFFLNLRSASSLTFFLKPGSGRRACVCHGKTPPGLPERGMQNPPGQDPGLETALVRSKMIPG